MGDEEWESFVKDVQSLIEANPNRNEAETKSKIITPVLEKLGWSFIKDEVQVEYPISFATATTHVDYALLLDERPVVFVEAKALRSEIKPKDIQQIIDYGRHEDVSWCVLTNGSEIRIYNTNWYDPKGEAGPEQALVDQVSLQEFIKRKDVLDKISKDFIQSGKIGEFARQIKQARDSVNQIATNRESIQVSIGKILKKYSGKLLHEKLEKITSRFLQELIQELDKFARQKRETVEKTEAKVTQSEDFPIADRKNLLNKYEDGLMVVTPSKPADQEESYLPSGKEFLKEYNAWGFVRVAENRNPHYFGLYITHPESAVKYFAKVKEIVDPTSKKSPVADQVKEGNAPESWNLKPGKKIIIFEEDSVAIIDSPIKKGQKVPFGLWYTTLKKFAEAKVTDDLIES